MTPTRTICPECHAALKVDELPPPGTRARCPHCGAGFSVPPQQVDSQISPEPQAIPVATLAPQPQAGPNPGTAREPAMHRLRGAIAATVPFWKRMAFEIRETASQTWAQTARITAYAAALVRSYFLGRHLYEKQLALGEKLYQAGLGDQNLRQQIAQIEERIRNVQAAKASTRLLRTERKGLHIRLTESYLENESVPPEVEQEHRGAQKAKESLDAQRQQAATKRDSLLPETPIAALRVSAGCAGLALFVLFLGFLLGPSPTLHGTGSNGGARDLTPPPHGFKLIINDKGMVVGWAPPQFSSDYRTLAVLAQTSEPSENQFTFRSLVRVWDLETGKERFPPITSTPSSFAENVVEGKSPRAFPSFALSRDGNYLAIATSEGTVLLVNAINGKPLETLTAYQLPGPIFEENSFSVAFSPDSRTLAARAPALNLVKLWGVATRREPTTLRPHEPGAIALCFSPDSEHLVTGGSHNGRGEIAIWDVRTGQRLKPAFPEQKSPVTWVGYFPDAESVATYSAPDRPFRRWDVTTRRESMSGSPEFLHAVAVGQHSPDGRFAAAEQVITPQVQANRTEELIKKGLQALNPAKPPTHVTVWEVASARKIATLSKAHDWVFFSPDSKQLATGGETERGKNTATVWDVATGKELFTLEAEEGSFLPFPPGAKTVVTGPRVQFRDVLNQTSYLRLWDADRVPRLASESRGSSETAAGSDDHMKRLQGTWRLVSLISDGEKTNWNLRPGPSEGGYYFTFARDQLVVKKLEEGPGNRTALMEYTYKLDQSKDPRAIDTEKLKGPDTLWPKPPPTKTFVPGAPTIEGRAPPGPTGKGIYLLNGDELKICFDASDRSRPARFDGSKGSKTIVFHLVRPWDENLP
jgi:uncharacterized protein (TIGR03067 family)